MVSWASIIRRLKCWGQNSIPTTTTSSSSSSSSSSSDSSSITMGDQADEATIEPLVDHEISGCKPVDTSELDNDISDIRKALDRVSKDDPLYADYSDKLASAYYSRFVQAKLEEDLNEAISLARQAAGNTSHKDPKYAYHCHRLGRYLSRRFLLNKNRRDLKEAIHHVCSAFQVIYGDDPRYAEIRPKLADLSHATTLTWKRKDERGDAPGDPIYFAKLAVEEDPKDSPIYGDFVRKMFDKCSSKYSKSKGSSLHFPFLDDALEYGRKAVDSTPSGHPLRAGLVEKVTGLLFSGPRTPFHLSRLTSRDTEADLQLAINLLQETTALISLEDSVRSRSLDELGDLYEFRFRKRKAASDLKNAISLRKDALACVPKDKDYPQAYASCARKLSQNFHDLFTMTESASDLDDAIFYCQKAYDMVGSGGSLSTQYINNLAGIYYLRFTKAKGDNDLNKAISLEQEAHGATPTHLPDSIVYWAKLTAYLGARFKMTGSNADLENVKKSFTRETVNPGSLDESVWLEALGGRGDIAEALGKAIDLCQDAANATSKDHPDYLRYMNNLSIALRLKHYLTRIEAELDQAISLSEQVVSLSDEDNTEHPVFLNNLAGHLRARSDKTKLASDLNRAISFLEEAITLTPGDDQNYTVYMNSLSDRLRSRFVESKSKADIDWAIALDQKAVNLTPETKANLPKYLDHLAVNLRLRFNLAGLLGDLDRAISLGQRAVDLTPRDDPKYAVYSINLRDHLYLKLTKSGSKASSLSSAAELQRALSLSQIAVNLTPDRSPEYVDYLDKLSKVHFLEYELRKYPAYLEKAILPAQTALDLTPPSATNRASRLKALGDLLSLRSAITGQEVDLDTAISLGEEAIGLKFQDDEIRAQGCNTLARYLWQRYGILGAMADLNRAIDLNEEAIEITPKDHGSRPLYLDSLGEQLFSRFIREKDVADLDKAIKVSRKALSRGSDDTAYHTYLYNLSRYRYARFKRTNETSDLQRCTNLITRARRKIPSGHHLTPAYLIQHGRALRSKFQLEHHLPSIELAIHLLQEAIQFRDKEDPRQITAMDEIGQCLELKYDETGDIDELKAALYAFEFGLKLSSAPPLDRIEAGIRAFHCHIRNDDWKSARAISKTIAELFPKLSLRILPRDDQQYAIKKFTTFSSLAASAVIRGEGSAAEALGILEAGRGIMAGLAIDSRSDLSILKNYDSLYSEYISLQDSLSLRMQTSDLGGISSQGAVSSIMRNGMGSDVDISKSMTQRQENLRKLAALEVKIRETVPGLSRFLLPMTDTEMIELAGSGPIVSFNVTEYWSGALIVTESGVKLLPLPTLRFDDLRNVARKLVGKDKVMTGSVLTRRRKLQEILQWLWEFAVRPVLEELNLLSPTGSEPLTHIWWVMSGYMGLAPLSAAGNAKETTSDYVISSYIPTLKALQYSRQKKLKHSKDLKMLIVAMSKTTGESDLNIDDEIQSVEESMDGMEQVVLRERPKREVYRIIPECHFVHFACHGVFDSSNPSESGLLLGDGTGTVPERLTVREMSDLKHDEAQIAYLSACSTAENASDDLIDEVIHIASAFQLIGFPHVIGTLWEADNTAATTVSRAFYRFFMGLCKKRNSSTDHVDIADALHYAVRELRLKNKKDVIAWAPFIHIGP